VFKRKEDVDVFLSAVARELSHPATVWLYGGCAVICLGRPNRETQDIDIDTLGDADVHAAFMRAAEARNVKLDDYDICSLPELPHELAGEPTHYARFGQLEVYFANSNTMVVGKLDRLAKDDNGDVRWMHAQGLLDYEQVVLRLKNAKALDERERARTRDADTCDDIRQAVTCEAAAGVAASVIARAIFDRHGCRACRACGTVDCDHGHGHGHGHGRVSFTG